MQLIKCSEQDGCLNEWLSNCPISENLTLGGVVSWTATMAKLTWAPTKPAKSDNQCLRVLIQPRRSPPLYDRSGACSSYVGPWVGSWTQHWNASYNRFPHWRETRVFLRSFQRCVLPACPAVDLSPDWKVIWSTCFRSQGHGVRRAYKLPPDIIHTIKSQSHHKWASIHILFASSLEIFITRCWSWISKTLVLLTSFLFLTTGGGPQGF